MNPRLLAQDAFRREVGDRDQVAASTKTAVVTGPAGIRWQGLATLNWVEKVDLLLPGTSKSWCTSARYDDRLYHGAALKPGQYHTLNGIRVASLIQCFLIATATTAGSKPWSRSNLHGGGGLS